MTGNDWLVWVASIAAIAFTVLGVWLAFGERK